MRHATGQLADRLEPLRLGELLPRACELGVALLRDRQCLIETAVQAAGLDQQNNRHDACGKQTIEAARIKADVETAPVGQRAQHDVEHPSAKDDDQPDIERGISRLRREKRQCGEAQQQNR